MIIYDYMYSLLHSPSVAQNLLVFAITIALGLTIGRIRLGNVSVGVAGVLFAGILIAQLGLHVNPEILDFMREFSLIIFVYTIGVQVGPRFFINFKQQGFLLNSLAIAAVALSVFIAFLAFKFGNLSVGATAGILAGGVTNTPSLGAMQQILANQTDNAVAMSTLAYAVSYPMGIMGIIITLMVLRTLGKINIQEQAQTYTQEHSSQVIGLNLTIENTNIDGIRISQLPDFNESQIVISRLMHKDHIIIPHHDTMLHVGDTLRAVGPKENMHKLQLLLGKPAPIALEEMESSITGRRVIITRRDIVGKTIQELQLRSKFDVTATRISHDDYELPAAANTIVYYGDALWIVGEPEAIDRFAKHVGDSANELNHPFILPLFFGIILGLIIGQIPIQLPGLPSPIKIGLAGGPLLVAILLSRLGRFGHVIWYMPTGANLLMRKFGISMFLAAVSLKSGANFVQTVMSPQGMQWFLWGAAITVIPVIIIGTIALWRVKLNYLSVSGLLAGILTNPPALAFANSLANCSAQSSAYSTVYPVVMMLRIISAQILIIAISYR